MVNRKCLDKKIEIIKVLPPNIIKPNIYVKDKTLDVLLKVDGDIINLEINSGYYNGLHERNAGYIFSKYSEYTKVSEDYSKMPKFYQLNFTKNLSKDYPLIGKYHLEEEETNRKYIDNLIIYEYNIDKIHDMCYNEGDRSYAYIAMLDSTKEELNTICEESEIMEEYKDKINKLNEDIEFTEWISEEEDARKVTNTLIHNAKEEGKIEIAKKMLDKNMNIKDIIDITGLSKEEVERL